MKPKDDISFRDRLTTIDEKGKRAWVFPKRPKGRLYNYRKVAAFFLYLFLFAAPFIKIKGEQLLLLNFIERKFVIFGVIFWPQDFHLFVLSMLTLIVFIVLFTVIYGRIFCGWICPQTIFMEFAFRQIEYLIEGDFHKQQKLNRQNWSFEKIWKKVLKNVIFFAFSVFIANVFLCYLLGTEKVWEIISAGPKANTMGFAGMLAFSGAFYFIFAWFREQVCTIACPYGRLQGVLLDANSIIVTYDYKRGEPRGHHNPLEDRSKSDKGDCIDCNSCVVVCPTGIDIRNGTQLECINCTACIDACNTIMDKVKRPHGLIRYASEKSISEGKGIVFNTRVISYSFVLAGLIVLVGFLFSIRGSFEATLLRSPGSLYQEYGTDKISNLFDIEVVNKTNDSLTVELKLLSPEGIIQIMGEPLNIGKGKIEKRMILIALDKDKLASSNTKLVLGIYSSDKLIETIGNNFIGPKKEGQ